MKPTKATKTTKPLKMAEATATAPVTKRETPTAEVALRAKKPQPKAASAPVASAPPPAARVNTPTTPRVTFRATRPGAQAVALAGSFNNWTPSSTPLTAGRDGQWSVDLELSPGVYEYRLVIDGEWMADPLATESTPNPFGGSNSIVRVG